MANATDGPTVSIIVAVAENGVIGRDGGMAWHYPADLRHFKETTMGHPVIMGRVTYENIVEGLGEPLPGRTSIVLTSRDREYPAGVVVVHSVPDALEAARDALAGETRAGNAGESLEDSASESLAGNAGDASAHDEIFVAGGRSVYEHFLPRADRLYWTEVHEEYDGDTEFPAVEWDDWRERERDDREQLSFVVYERRA